MGASLAAAEHPDVAALIAVADQESRSKRWLAAIPMLVAVQLWIVVVYPHSSIATLSYVVCATILLIVLAQFGYRWRRTAEALAVADDLRMVGPLVDRLGAGLKRRRTRRVIRQALIRVLPRLRPEDAVLLSAEQRTHLAAALKQLAVRGRDVELQLAILAAFHQIGPDQALPIVEGLAHDRGRSTNRRRVREAAEACLARLAPEAEA